MEFHTLLFTIFFTSNMCYGHGLYFDSNRILPYRFFRVLAFSIVKSYLQADIIYLVLLDIFINSKNKRAVMRYFVPGSVYGDATEEQYYRRILSDNN